MHLFNLQTHVRRLLSSYRHWSGREWIPGNLSEEEKIHALFEAPFVVVSHGVETDPILNYGNRAALELWEMDWEEFTRTPSRLTAEPMSRRERERLLNQVTERGFIDDYQGVRVAKSGRRFKIEQAMVFNLINEGGHYCGQAATFSHWVFL